MKKKTSIIPILLIIAFYSFAQKKDTVNISYDGLYIAKTGGVPAANLEIFTYLRFYEDGTVVLQSVSSNDAAAVAKWFGRDKKYSQKGTYQTEGNKITIRLNNKGTADAQLEGKVETDYKGTITETKKLCLTRNDEKKENCFDFTKTD
ncbi:MAG: hypothetical protein ACOVP7_01560 [Lacibacter sp.]